MSTCKVICVTSRILAGEDFRERLRRIAAAGVSGVILREKDMDEQMYAELALWAKKVCGEKGVPLAVHTYAGVARRLGIERLHLSLRDFLAMSGTEKRAFHRIGVSVHSADEARCAEEGGASYITAGHIFATDCKKDLPPKGLLYLEEVCAATGVPVYAIGGITPENAPACMEAGAAGICLMSSLMQAPESDLSRIIRIF